MKIRIEKKQNNLGKAGGFSVILKNCRFGAGWVLQSKTKPVRFWKKVSWDNLLVSDVIIRQFNFFIWGNFALGIGWVITTDIY